MLSQALWKRYFCIKTVVFRKIISIFAVFFPNVESLLGLSQEGWTHTCLKRF